MAMAESALKKMVKGFLGLVGIIAGIFIFSADSQPTGENYWAGIVIGLVLISVGLAYFGEFIKLLISGEVSKGIAPGMKEWMKVFLAIASIIAGVIFALTAKRNHDLGEGMAYGVGVVLIAGGSTYFWLQSSFHKR